MDKSFEPVKSTVLDIVENIVSRYFRNVISFTVDCKPDTQSSKVIVNFILREDRGRGNVLQLITYNVPNDETLSGYLEHVYMNITRYLEIMVYLQ